MEEKNLNINTHLSEYRSMVEELSEKSQQLRRYL